MRTSETLLLDFIRQSPQFRIPVNQRRYAWTRRHCRQLWDDILDAGERHDVREHFLGPVMFVAAVDPLNAHWAPFMVYDGQQRLTTITLILKALYAEGYGRATQMAQTLTSRAALPDAARLEAAKWLDRDRDWEEELASARKLTRPQEQDVDTAGLSEALREAALLAAVRAAIGQETARLARSPAPEQWTVWTGDEPLVAGDRIAWRAGGTVHHAAVAFPGDAGGMRASDTLLLKIARSADGAAPDEAGRMVEISAQALWDARCARAAWSVEGLRKLEAARQYSVPSAACRLACPEPVAGDRIAWTEAAGRSGEVRTVEAVVATRTETPDGHELALRAIRASGPGAPEPGVSIQRTADEVTARGCFRAPWSDEARRARVLDPPKEVEEQSLKQDLGYSHGGGISM